MMRPRLSVHQWVLLLLTLLGITAAMLLGRWQLSRAAQKIQAQSVLDERLSKPPLDVSALADASDKWLNRRLVLKGQWLHERTVFLDNRPMQGRVGFYVMTPLQTEQGSVLLVQRGWVPRDAMDRTRLPTLPPVTGLQSVQGHLAAQPARLYELGEAGGGVIRQNLVPAAFARETGLPLLPWVLVQTGPTPEPPLLRDWPAPAVDVHKHYGYAFQWFALGALQLGLYVWFQIIRPRRRRRAPDLH